MSYEIILQKNNIQKDPLIVGFKKKKNKVFTGTVHVDAVAVISNTC